MEQTIDTTKGAGHQPPPLRISRTLHARRETVFNAWTRAEHVKQWFSPATFTVPDAKVELRVGGPFEVCMRAPNGQDHWSRGTFVEVEPFTRLVIDMYATDSAGGRLFRAYTEVNFADALGGTQMDVVQTYTFVDPAMAAPMVAGAPEGWRTTLDKLETLVVRLQGGGHAPDERSVVHAIFSVERTYDAPVGRVWSALTDKDAKAKWFSGPSGWKEIERSMDVRPGGREVARGRFDHGLVTSFEAYYFDVVPNARLVYSYEMHLNDRKISVSLATMELKASGGMTTLKVTEQGAFLDGYDDAGSREQGTGFLLDKIGASLMN